MSPIRILIVGDTHGNTKQMQYFCALAGERKIQHLVVLGDFGLWTHQMNGHLFLDEVNAYAQGNNLSVYAIPGNHENWDHWNAYVDMMPTHKGFAIVRSRVLLAPKVHSWVWDHKQFFCAGGAVSIDAERRRMSESSPKRHMDHYGWPGGGKGPRTEWWPNEQLTEDDVARMNYRSEVAGKMVDYMFSHDCSDFTPFKNRIKPDPESQIHRKRMDRVLRMVNPKIHFHGHMHDKYDWINTLGTGLFGSEPDYQIQTYGLEADYKAMYAREGQMATLWNWGILDTETDTFTFRGEGMQFRSLM